MSTSTQFTKFQPEAQPISFRTTRHRFTVVGLSAIVLATIGAAGIAVVSRVQEVTHQPAIPEAASVSAAPSAPPVGLSPSREAWYVEDRYASAPAARSTRSERLTPWRDAWYLDDQPASGSAPGTAHLTRSASLVKDRWFDEPAAEPTVTSMAPEPLRDRWYLDPRPDASGETPRTTSIAPEPLRDRWYLDPRPDSAISAPQPRTDSDR
jgi:hypothetical protein